MARALPDAGRFAEDEIIIAFGVTIEGEKVVLGFVQSGTEKERVIKDFLNSLMDRGLNIDQGLLCVIPAWRQIGMEARDYILGLKRYSETGYSSNAANGIRGKM
ncbi:MAG: transposase [Deltaproteobacteria bacterium]|nr:transposase [Deltaproteobacteria bacterium]MBW1931297.1 transposase [Deltaproteobacteria bacterium]MBW2026764.1 transposase [Deltaproteobacteria bacterium]MBW2127263.1 transposase [Deltaproteobacteria bacterium]